VNRLSSDATEYVVGVDFGTLSGRAVVVRVRDGEELADAVLEYPHGVLEDALPDGTRLGADWALQVPDDYRQVLRVAVPKALHEAGVDPQRVVGIATDFTACTMVPTLADGTPLNEVRGLEGRAHAYAKLWKHHAAQPQADRLNRVAADRAEPWLPRYGGLISSEWEFAKGLQIFEEDREVYDRMSRFVEAADWIVWQLCGSYVRNACAAGYKGILQDGRYPSTEFLEDLAEGFGGFVRDKLDQPVGQLGEQAGRLTPEAARWTGLPEGIAVAVGNVDAHVTAAAVRAVEPGQMVAIMGTSTCQIMNADVLREVPGMCGVVDGGIVAGSFGYEAGQSGVGDTFAWFTRTCVPESYAVAARKAGESLHEHLTRLTAAKAVGAHGLVALDWHSGNRSVLVDHHLSGLVVGLTLATPPEDVYRALLEATAFGMRIIVEAFATAGVPVEDLVVAGGLTRNGFLMQLYSDVLRMPLSVAESAQAPALGSAIHAAVAAGRYPDVHTAAAAMGRVERHAYLPDEERAAAYDELFAIYQELHDHFGRTTSLMRRLKALG
jgi:L-ribulokinase